MNPMTAFQRLACRWLVLTVQLLPAARAALPTIEAPSHTNAGTGLMGTLVGYFMDGIYWIGILTAGVALISVATMFIGTLAKVHHGKATWGELGALAVAGVACIVAILWMVTKAFETITTGPAAS